MTDISNMLGYVFCKTPSLFLFLTENLLMGMHKLDFAPLSHTHCCLNGKYGAFFQLFSQDLGYLSLSKKDQYLDGSGSANPPHTPFLLRKMCVYEFVALESDSYLPLTHYPEKSFLHREGFQAPHCLWVLRNIIRQLVAAVDIKMPKNICTPHGNFQKPTTKHVGSLKSIIENVLLENLFKVNASFSSLHTDRFYCSRE
ncbi:hypothetical protein EGR_00396 [Echinococcus granulosus]|uniref:Uncharacterized protein n=1 Tax=Echinococcus granulosus TaxID=6210 RepID=W6V2C2_ECHGR|nr:hypothetical protein EGR_00396 [Echinococcus granulosus]EUB65127.1 hypothetical protein EGR_00396 [Echinococcus granulosus]